ncbi:MAG: glycosyltransferase [Rikenellaceae bacterium]
MRVVHIVHGKVNPNGENGVSRVVYFLNKYQKLLGVQSEIWAFVDGVKLPTTYKRDKFVTIEMYPRLTPFNRNNHPILKKFDSERENIDIVHFHMIWFVDKNILAGFLNKIDIPFVAMTHGTYSKPVSSKGVKKISAKYLLELPFLNSANELHILSANEGKSLVKYGANRPSFIVPNGIEIEEIPKEMKKDYFGDRAFDGKIKIGWIGVFRKDKNLELIIHSFKELQEETQNRCHFIFMGPDHKGYKSTLIELCDRLDCANSFSFYDKVYKEDKYNALNSFDLYIMSSSSEGMSMAMLDAMALGKPMVLTKGCNMSNYHSYDFFEECEPSPISIASAIETLVARQKDWDVMGQNAKKLIDKVFNWEIITRQLVEQYKRILSKYL